MKNLLLTTALFIGIIGTANASPLPPSTPEGNLAILAMANHREQVKKLVGSAWNGYWETVYKVHFLHCSEQTQWRNDGLAWFKKWDSCMLQKIKQTAESLK